MDAAILAVVALNLVYGAVHTSDYGQSWDDPGDAAYGQTALRAYGGSSGYLESGDRKYYGPFYFMISGGLSAGFHSAVPAWNAVDIRHALNFVSFQLAVLAIYGIARRILGPAPALITALLFMYQPVFFGHAFINQKDIPLLAGFTCAVFLGLRMGDRTNDARAKEVEPVRSPAEFFRSIALGWRSLPSPLRWCMALLALAGLAICADLVFGNMILGGAKSVVAAAYQGVAWGPVNALFSFIARDAYKTPLAAYAAKIETMFGWIRIVGVYVALLPAVLLMGMITRGDTRRNAGMDVALRRAVPAAIVLGLTISIRAVGLFAGVLVSLYLLARRERPSLPSLLLYWLVALSVSYLTWPYLWGAAVGRFLESIRLLADFPSHFVLFRGQTFSSTILPWDYLPTLLGIQLTEPVLILLVVGLVALPAAWRKSEEDRRLLALICLWFLVPFAASLFLQVPLYSNFRQVLFALPPLFFLAGIGIDFLWKRARGRLLRAVLVIAILVPGLAGIVRLRPYEYIYYNAFVGGERGAEGKFAHDYWCTSYREAMAFVNLHAPEGSRVAIAEPYAVAATFARPDLDPVRGRNDPQAAYVLRCNNRGALTLQNLEEFPVALVVTRSGVVLSVVFQTGAGPAEGSHDSGAIPNGVTEARELLRERSPIPRAGLSPNEAGPARGENPGVPESGT